MAGGSAGSIYADARLDTSEFETGASKLTASAEKISQAFEQAGTSAEKLESANSGVLSLAEQAELAAQAAGNLETALRDAIANGADPAAILRLNTQFERAAATADRLGEVVYGSADASGTAASAMDMLDASAGATSDTMRGLMESMGGFSSFANTVLLSASRSLGTFATRAAGISSSSFGGILLSRTTGTALRTLVKGLSAAKLGWVGLGAAAVYGGYKIISAINEAKTANDQWQKSIASVNKEQTENFKATINADVESNLSGFQTKVNTVWDEIKKALTDGEPDTADVVSKLNTSVNSTFASIRTQVQVWYDTEMSKLDLSTDEGQKAAQAITETFESMNRTIEKSETVISSAIDNIAGMSTEAATAALDELEGAIERLQADLNIVDQLTALQGTKEASAYSVVSKGYTTDSRLIAQAANYVDDNTRLQFLQKENELLGKQEELTKAIQQAEIDGNPQDSAKYSKQLGEVNTELEELERNYDSMRQSEFADLFQTIMGSMFRESPTLQNEFYDYLRGGAFNINDPKLSQMVTDWYEAGLLSGITDVDLSQFEKGTKEHAEALSQILRDIWNYGNEGGLGEAVDNLIPILDGSIDVSKGEGIQEIANAISALNAAIESGNSKDVPQFVYTLLSLYNTLSGMDLNNTDVYSYFSSIAEALGVAGLNANNLIEYLGGLLGEGALPVEIPLKTQPVVEDTVKDPKALRDKIIRDTLFDLFGTYNPDEIDVNDISMLLHPKAEVEEPETNQTEEPKIPTWEEFWGSTDPIPFDVPAEFNFVPDPNNPESLSPEESIAKWFGLNGNGEPLDMVTAEISFTVEANPIPEFTELGMSNFAKLARSELESYSGANINKGAGAAIDFPVDVNIIPQSASVDQTQIQMLMSQSGGFVLDAPVTFDPSQITMPDVTSEARSAGTDAGSQFGAGIVAGIQSKSGAVMAAARAIAAAAAAAIRNALQIASPSKVTKEYGEFFDLGFVEGIENKMPQIDESVRDALDIVPASVYNRQMDRTNDVSKPVSAGIDYDRLARAISNRPALFFLNGRRFAAATANDVADAQSFRERRIEMGLGR